MSHRFFTFIVAASCLPAAPIASNYTGMEQGGFGLSTTGARAVQFTAGFTGVVTDVQLWLSGQSNSGSAYLDTYIMADNGGLPGVTLEHIGNMQGTPSGSFALATGGASGTTLLTAGTKYWIGGVTGIASDQAIVWGSGGDLRPEAVTQSSGVGGAWASTFGGSTSVQFTSNADAASSPVLEPASVGIVGATLAVLVVRTRKLRRVGLLG